MRISEKTWTKRWRKVVTIDFASVNGPAAPFCAAMTVEK
jgi:hypothetical protein